MTEGDPGRDPEPEGWPIGFVVLVVAASIYLLIRFVQMGAWLLDRIAGP